MQQCLDFVECCLDFRSVRWRTLARRHSNFSPACIPLPGRDSRRSRHKSEMAMS